MTFDSIRPLFSVAHTPHLQQPEPGLDGDKRVAMATAHRILTWGPAGSAREREAWPQRDGWRAEDRGPGGPCGGRGCSVGQSRHTLLFIILLNGPNDLTRRPRAGKPTAAQRGGNSSGTSTPLPHPRPPALSAGLREVGEAGTSPLLPPLASTPTRLGSPAPSLCAAPGLASVGDCGRMLGSRACVQVRVRVQVGVCVHVRVHVCLCSRMPPTGGGGGAWRAKKGEKEKL